MPEDTRLCTQCQVRTEWRTISVHMGDDQTSVTVTGVPAMVCPDCGEEYLPGLQAMALSKAAEDILGAVHALSPLQTVA